MGGSAMKTLRRWLVWVPVLMVASLFYWTVALGLGGMSLMEVSSLSRDGAVNLNLSLGDNDGTAMPANDGTGMPSPDGTAMPARDGYEPIIVHLEESVEPEDVDDNPGCGLSSDGAAGAPSGVDAEPSATVGHSGATPLVY
jgi:hypothetical protein